MRQPRPYEHNLLSDARGYAATLSENLKCTKGICFCRQTNGRKVVAIVGRG
jgi:hypothetical protein